MIDLHCHILPGIDDGPAEMTSSVEMARAALKEGITHIVATPHVKSTIFPAGTVSQKISDLQNELNNHHIPITILPGGEIFYLYHESPDVLKQFSINQTPYVLIEFPHSHLPKISETVVFNILLLGFIPIIAHPERNPSVIIQPDLISQIIDKGALIQMTAGSITGYFGREVQACSEYLIRKNRVHIMASDAHSPEARPVSFSQAFQKTKKLIGESAANRLFIENPSAILKGERVHVLA